MFVNYENMTIDQLLEKQIELKRKVAQAYQAGMSPGLIGQMQNMLEQLIVEYHSKVALDAEQHRRERLVDEGKDPNADEILNIGDFE